MTEALAPPPPPKKKKLEKKNGKTLADEFNTDCRPIYLMF